nr:hypothetical protein [Pantoea cypripedii]
MHIYNRGFWLGLLIVLALSLVGISIKYNDFKNGRGIENIQATYHSLLTLNSLSSLPLEQSALLPTVNLNGDNNKNIPWAAAVKTKDGNFVYTSFPSLGFVAPYVLLRLIDSPLTTNSLFYLNSAFSILTSALFFCGLYIILIRSEASNTRRIIAALAGSSIMIFSCESLVSSGLVYWPQSLSQLIFSFIFLLFSVRKTINNRAFDILFLLSLTAFSMTEWTGYVFSGLMFAYAIIARFDGWKRISLVCVLAPAIAIIIFAIQIESVITLSEFLRTSLERFGVRGAAKADFSLLLKGYWTSFGLYLIFIIPFFFLLRIKKYRFILIVCFLPMIENIILANHAIAFTFDRWKLAFLLGLSISIICSRNGIISNIIILIVVASSIIGIKQYKHKIDIFSSWTKANINNKDLSLKIAKIADLRCASIFSDTRVRGYPVLLFMRNIHEGVPESPNEVMEGNAGVCNVVILHGSMPTPDMPEYTFAEIWKRGQHSPVIIR